VPGQYTLRPPRPEEDALLFALHREAIEAYVAATWGAWDDGVQRDLWSRERAGVLSVVEVDGAVCGFLELLEAEVHVEVVNLELAATHRGSGLGTAILRDIARRACPRPVLLQVLKANPRARDLYGRLGFEPTGESATHVFMRRDPTDC
jgi:ribosomal protein S18 acetylase RimI-like enzyme